MERKSCFIGDVICILLITAVVNATAEVKEFDFYRIQVHWSPSYRSQRGHSCTSGILDYFTVFALIPMYSPNRPVPPYNDGRNCTNTIPKKRNQIRFTAFREALQEDMVRYMPNLGNYADEQANNWFWLRQWDTYAKCFTRSDEPQFYYHAALDVPKTMDLLEILKEEGGIVPTDERSYKASDIAEVISKFVGEQVLIHCNLSENGKIQLLSVGICFTKHAVAMTCPERFFLCAEEIWFPATASSA